MRTLDAVAADFKKYLILEVLGSLTFASGRERRLFGRGRMVVMDAVGYRFRLFFHRP